MNKFKLEIQDISNHQKNQVLEQLFSRSHSGMNSFQYKDVICDFQLCQFNQKAVTQPAVFLSCAEQQKKPLNSAV